jgi:hypothetical protein
VRPVAVADASRTLVPAAVKRSLPILLDFLDDSAGAAESTKAQVPRGRRWHRWTAAPLSERQTAAVAYPPVYPPSTGDPSHRRKRHSSQRPGIPVMHVMQVMPCMSLRYMSRGSTPSP